MEHKHTPGPWMAVGDYVFGGEDESFESVCLLKNTIYSNSKEANARLIAAAPVLLAALQKVREDINWMINNEALLNDYVFDYIDNAIEQATGEQK